MATQPIPNLGESFADILPRDRLLTVRELAAALGLSESALYKAINSGSIPYLKINSAVRFSGPAIAAWLEEKSFTPRSLKPK